MEAASDATYGEALLAAGGLGQIPPGMSREEFLKLKQAEIRARRLADEVCSAIDFFNVLNLMHLTHCRSGRRRRD